MEAHPSIPHAQQLPTHEAFAREVRERAWNAGVASSVECCITEPPSKNHAERTVEEQVVCVTLRHWGAGRLQGFGRVPVGKNHTK